MKTCHACGRMIKRGEAFAQSTFGGKIHFFCCPMCLSAFKAESVQRRKMHCNSESADEPGKGVAPLPRNVSFKDISLRFRLRAVFFGLGDFLFLLLVSVVTAIAMYRIHLFHWNFLFTVFLGMVIAMIIQVLLAWCAAPLLGSIECMIPSMVVAMVSSMTVCLLHLGQYLTWSGSLKLSLSLGAGMFLFVQAYGYLCDKSLRRINVAGRGC